MSRLLECIILRLLWLIKDISGPSRSLRAIITKKGLRVVGINQWMLRTWEMICECGKAALLISMRVTRERNFRQHVRFVDQRHKEAHFSFVAQTNQKCTAWTSQPNLVCLSSTESGAELSQLTPMHAQLLASNSLCSSSCTKSQPCQGKHSTISPRAAKVRRLVGSREGRRKKQ